MILGRGLFIYLGTAEEGLIGKPASDGCIRMYNNDVIELFDLVDRKSTSLDLLNFIMKKLFLFSFIFFGSYTYACLSLRS